MIERHNILSLLGSDSRKYHSCIITSYSFDFLFFEQRVLPILHRAGIININLFIDADMLQRQLEEPGNVQLHAKKSYSITPVSLNGAFHPKIVLAVGKKEGMLAIGSGNVTSSGLSGNEEIWATFHTKNKDSSTLPAFKYVTNYLYNLQSLAFGSNKKKFSWISENALWYKSLFEIPSPTEKMPHGKGTLQIFSTMANHSIYQDITSQLPKKPLQIKIVSPYYNANGQLIKNLCKDLKPKKVHCVVDSTCGTLPYKMVENIPVEFSDWNNLKKQKGYEYARLHAKAIQFEYPLETYLLFGSPNCTIEALGTETSNSKNAEMAIWMYANHPKDFLKGLGIIFPSRGNYNLSDYRPIELLPDKSNNTEHKKIELLHAELDHNELSLNIGHSDISGNIHLVIEDAGSNELYKVELKSVSSQVQLHLPTIAVEKAFKVALFQNSSRISNYTLIHLTALLLRTNPDTRLEKLNELLDLEHFDDLKLDELLKYVHFKDRQTVSNNSIRHTRTTGDVEEGEEDITAITEEEFNKNAAKTDSHDSSARYQMTMLEEFLNSLSFGESVKKEDVSDSSEISAMEAGDDGLEDENMVVAKPMAEVSFLQGQRLKKRIYNTINRITKSLSWHKESLAKSRLYKEEYAHKANFEQIYALLIACHLILLKRNISFTEYRNLLTVRYTDKDILAQLEYEYELERHEDQKGYVKGEVSYTIDENYVDEFIEEVNTLSEIKLLYIDGTPSQTIQHPFIDVKVWPVDNDVRGIEKFLLDGLGSFIVLLMNGEETYQGKELVRWQQLKERLFYRSIMIIENYHWPKNAHATHKLILLNLFHWLKPENLSAASMKKELERLFSILEPKLKQNDLTIEDAVNTYEAYLNWYSVYSKNVKQLKLNLDTWKVGKIIFNKKLGFGKIDHYYANQTVNIESPFGTPEKNTDILGYSEQFIGLKPVFFD